MTIFIPSNWRKPNLRSISSSSPTHTPFDPEPLGRPLPFDEHACSVSLPTWSSVVGYEEGNPCVTSQLRCGYPRFVYHPYILKLMEYVIQNYGNQEQDCLILPSAEAAARCQMFLQKALYGTFGNQMLSSSLARTSKKWTDNALVDRNSQAPDITRIEVANIHAVLFPAETLAGSEAKAYWQHTGEIVSSRRAEVALTQLGQLPLPQVCPQSTFNVDDASTGPVHHSSHESSTSVFDLLRERIASWTDVPKSHVHLFPSGMASIYTALRMSRLLKLEQQNLSTDNQVLDGGTSIVFGFPYLDTLKLCSRVEFCPGGVEFFGKGNANDIEILEDLLKQQKSKANYCALFTEVPSNPLLQTPNVPKLRQLANKYGFAFIVDDTIGNFANIHLLGNSDNCADAICTSLTKLVSGRGDAMAGSLVVNPRTETGAKLQAALENRFEDHGLFVADAWAIYRNSEDFLVRNEQINATAEELSDWLQDHKDVEKVYYPKYTDMFRHVSTGRGHGGLMSILLEPHICQRSFYDALQISKGPSLGTNFSLMCPYTLLAHYHELDFAMSHHVKPNLLRISIGLEPLEVLKQRFEQAFEISRLYPPVPKAGGNLPHRDFSLQRRHYSSTRVISTTERLIRFGMVASKKVLR
jgi:cystathionine gamma-synthase